MATNKLTVAPGQTPPPPPQIRFSSQIMHSFSKCSNKNSIIIGATVTYIWFQLTANGMVLTSDITNSVKERNLPRNPEA